MIKSCVIRVFNSSTFAYFKLGRDELVKKAFPELSIPWKER